MYVSFLSQLKKVVLHCVYKKCPRISIFYFKPMQWIYKVIPTCLHGTFILCGISLFWFWAIAMDLLSDTQHASIIHSHSSGFHHFDFKPLPWIYKVIPNMPPLYSNTPRVFTFLILSPRTGLINWYPPCLC